MIVDFPKKPPAKPSPPEKSSEPPEADNRTAVNIAALILIAALLLGGLWVFNKLTDANAMMNCLSSGRRNCDEVLHPAQ